MRHFVTILSLALFVLSWTHIKACFPVAVVNLLLFGHYAVMYRDRRYALPAIAALTVAVGTWIPFANAMLLAELKFIHIVTSLSVYAGILALFPQLDRLINRLPVPACDWSSELRKQDGTPVQLCYLLSSVLNIGMAAIWLLWVIASVTVSNALGNFGNLGNIVYVLGLIPLAGVVANFAILTVRTRTLYYSLGMWSMIAVAAFASALYLRVPPLEIASSATVVCAVVSFLSLLPMNRKSGLSVATYSNQFSRSSENGEPHSLVTAFLFPLHDVTAVVLLTLTAAVHIPTVLVANVSLIPLFAPLGTVAVLVWLVAIRLVFKNQGAGIAAAVAFPLLCSAIAISVPGVTVTYATLPLIWSVAGVATSLMAYRSSSNSKMSMQSVALTWVVVSAGLSLGSFELVARLTALISLTSLAISERNRYGKNSWTALAIAANVQILMLVVGLSGVTSWFELLQNPDLCLDLVPTLAVTLAASFAVWDIRRISFDPKLRLASQVVLRTLFAAALLGCFLISSADANQTNIVLTGIAIAATAEFVEAVRKQREANLWGCFALAALALAWLISQGQLHVGGGAVQVVLLTTSVAALLASRLAREVDSSLGFASRPLDQIGLTCPALLVVATVFRNILGLEQIMPGVDSAMLLAAAAIYFHRGLATADRGFVIASALVFNIASVHLCWSLSLHDLQLYLVPLGMTIIGMVQLLKKEIPASAHNPIRNIGALVILVSPVFEILNGSWLHLITLLVLSVLVILLAIGLRIRTLVYVGSAFLFADLVALVIKSAMANPGMLWIGGLGIGIAVIALAAICENHREQLLAKIRILSAELATWN